MRWLATLLIASFAVCAVAQTVAKRPTTRPAAKAGVRKPMTGKSTPPPEPPIPEAQPQQVIPLRPSQRPSVPPRVSYQDGKLTVVAENTTMADIFSAIRDVAGIRIETAGGAMGDRVAAKIGPGSPREVLLSLLQGSRYDYLLLGKENDPDAVERAILTPKAAPGAQSASTGPLRPPQPAFQGQEVDMSQEPIVEEDENQGFAPANVPAEPQVDEPRPGETPMTAPGQPQPNPTEPKTPEQLLEDLRRIERERQEREFQQQRQQVPNPRDTRGERPR